MPNYNGLKTVDPVHPYLSLFLHTWYTCEVILGGGPCRALMRMPGSVAFFLSCSHLLGLLSGRHCVICVPPVTGLKNLHCSCYFYSIWEVVPFFYHTLVKKVLPVFMIVPHEYKNTRLLFAQHQRSSYSSIFWLAYK